MYHIHIYIFTYNTSLQHVYIYTVYLPETQQFTRPSRWCRIHRCHRTAFHRSLDHRRTVVRPSAQRLTRAEVAFHQEVAETAIDAWWTPRKWGETEGETNCCEFVLFLLCVCKRLPNKDVHFCAKYLHSSPSYYRTIVISPKCTAKMFRVWPWCKFAGWGIRAFWRLTSTIVLTGVHHEKHKCTTREKGTVTMVKPWKQGHPCQNYKVLFGYVFPVLSMAASRNIFQSFELVTSIYTSRVSKKPQSLCPKCQENPRNQWNPWDMAAVTLHLPQSPCLRLVRLGSPGHSYQIEQPWKAQTLKVGNWDQHGHQISPAPIFCRCASTTLWHCVFERLPLSNHQGKRWGPTLGSTPASKVPTCWSCPASGCHQHTGKRQYCHA